MTGASPLLQRRKTREKRESLRAEHKAESTWRRHEIGGRIKAIESGQKKLELQLQEAFRLIEELRPPRVIEGRAADKELPEGKP